MFWKVKIMSAGNMSLFNFCSLWLVLPHPRTVLLEIRTVDESSHKPAERRCRCRSKGHRRTDVVPLHRRSPPESTRRNSAVAEHKWMKLHRRKQSKTRNPRLSPAWTHRPLILSLRCTNSKHQRNLNPPRLCFTKKGGLNISRTIRGSATAYRSHGVLCVSWTVVSSFTTV